MPTEREIMQKRALEKIATETQSRYAGNPDTVCEIAPLSNVQGQISELDSANDWLSELVDNLTMRLNSVLSDDYPMNADGSKNPTIAIYSLANQICNQKERVQYQARRIQEVLNRLEL